MFFLTKRRGLAPAHLVLAGVMVAGALTGCMSTEVADKAQKPVGMNNSGTYPLLGEPLRPATTQMSDADASAMGAKLQALADARKAGKVSEAEYNRKVQEMKTLGKSAQDAAKPDQPASN